MNDTNGVVLGDDWVSLRMPEAAGEQPRHRRRRWIALNRSPLARKIITFNLIGLIVLVAGVLYLNPIRDTLAYQREQTLAAEARLIADVYELSAGAGHALQAGLLPRLDLASGIDVFVFDAQGNLIETTAGTPRREADPVVGLEPRAGTNVITGILTGIWERLSGIFAGAATGSGEPDRAALARELAMQALAGGTHARSGPDVGSMFTVATPVLRDGKPIATVAVATSADALDALVRSEREQILQVFIIAILVSIGLSVVLASTIANPISDLAAAAETGRDRDSGAVRASRVRIPDLSGRPDEIGRLSRALRGMVSALYDRIDANEQFAADVAHEIKNPLASLRSAVGTLRLAKREDQREKLLDVIDHDVRRLDRLVSDISNASRLDSELVKEEEEPFDLLAMLRNITEHLGQEARAKGVDFMTDMPAGPIIVQGLEARMAQVFVNLITNAISFCEDGDAIRVWARQRENRVLVVVEDTGPGIPEEALTKIFNRFYSHRPEGQFGNNSGLGLAISKQIVEAHGGVIWAENIRPTEADVTSDPLGARFVVGLPV